MVILPLKMMIFVTVQYQVLGGNAMLSDLYSGSELAVKIAEKSAFYGLGINFALKWWTSSQKMMTFVSNMMNFVSENDGFIFQKWWIIYQNDESFRDDGGTLSRWVCRGDLGSAVGLISPIFRKQEEKARQHLQNELPHFQKIHIVSHFLLKLRRKMRDNVGIYPWLPRFSIESSGNWWNQVEFSCLVRHR